MERLLVAAPSRYRTVIACGLFSGLRLSELLGLTWTDVDLGERALKVRYQLSRHGERVALKTVAARRDVILMSQLARELDAMRARSRFSEDRDLVFSATTGQTRPSQHHRARPGQGRGSGRARWRDLPCAAPQIRQHLIRAGARSGVRLVAAGPHERRDHVAQVGSIKLATRLAGQLAIS
jgi:integrase